MEMKMSKEERMLKMIREILVSCPEAGQEFADDYELDAHGVEEIINALQISKTDLEYALDDLINYVPESFFEPKYINEKVLHAWESIPSGIRQLFGTYPEDGSRELYIRTHNPILSYEKLEFHDLDEKGYRIYIQIMNQLKRCARELDKRLRTFYPQELGYKNCLKFYIKFPSEKYTRTWWDGDIMSVKPLGWGRTKSIEQEIAIIRWLTDVSQTVPRNGLNFLFNNIYWISALTPSCVNVFDLFINACTASPDEISADEYPPYEEFLFPLLYQRELDRVELCLEWYKTHEKNPIGEYYFTEYLLNGCMDEKLIITRTRNLKKELRTFIKEHKEIFLKEMREILCKEYGKPGIPYRIVDLNTCNLRSTKTGWFEYNYPDILGSKELQKAMRYIIREAYRTVIGN